jgi:DNA-binding transcriptional MerR regulator
VFAIGAFAHLSGVSAKALRLYDRMGLFCPAWTDAATGYRYFSAAQLPELRRIVALRDTGMPLAEIARVRQTSDLRPALEQRRLELEAQRADLERRLAALAIRIDAPARGEADAADVVLRMLEPQLVASRNLTADEDVGEAFYALETQVRDAGVRAPRPPGAVIGGDDERRRIFIPIRRPLPTTARITVERLAATRAATVLHHGGYARLGDARATLDRWIGRAGMVPSGPARILYLQFGAETELRLPSAFLVERAADFVTELQQPVMAA